MTDARQRLEQFLAEKYDSLAVKVEQLTPDASTREYFRIGLEKTAIACVYQESFDPLEQNYLDVTTVFRAAHLPVAEIYAVDSRRGIIILEDFGDTILRDVLERSTEEKKESLLSQSISLIARIQAATNVAYELDSIASRLKFDEEKLVWELNFFKTHYFETLKKQPLGDAEESALTVEFVELSKELENRARVLCHRDFHAANLMIDRQNRLRIIDHQDARIGAASYDLVSLLLDRVSDVPSKDWLDAKKRLLLAERESLGLEKIEYEVFDEEFKLQTVQRCLKAIGTFSFQSATRGKIHFIKYIEPMFRIVLDAAEKSRRFPVLQNIIREQILVQ